MTELERQVRFLNRYAVGSSIAFLILIGAAFVQAPQRLKLLEVERLNVVNPDGILSLAIAGKGAMPGPMMDGKQFPPELSGGRTTSAGMIFFNESGDEVGGMTWAGIKTADGYQAGEHLSFDHWKQDEVVTLDYSDDGRRHRAGLAITDRPRDYPLTVLIPKLQAMRAATGPVRDSLQRELQTLGSQGKLGAQRIFLGSDNATAVLRLRDRLGKERIRLFVDTADVARLEFLDSQGAVIARFPQ
jgi:hypothetical protein